MAGRPKKENTKEVVDSAVDNLSALMKKLEEMQAQLNELKAENDSLKTQKVAVDEDEELTADTDITVISQTVGKLVLSTLGNGLGTVYRFEQFGEVQDIPFGDLRDIVKNKPYFAREGLYYIANAQAVKKLRLGAQYKNIIDNKTLEHLFENDAKTIVSLYESAPTLQQQQIVGLIEDRLAKKIDVDGNVLIQIGKLCGKDFLLTQIEDEEE